MYITTQKFNKLMTENFETRLKQVNLVNKTDFNSKLTSFNKWITWKNKTFTSSKKAKCSNNKWHSFFLGRIYFASNDGSQNTFPNQPTLDTLELKERICP